MLNTASGAVQSTVDILRTIKEKAIDAANDTNTDADRAIIQKQINHAMDQIDENASTTYNGKYLVDGSLNSAVVPPGTYTTISNTCLETVDNPYIKMFNYDPTTVPINYLKDNSGAPLYVAKDDTVVISYVYNGETKSASVSAWDPDGFNFDTLNGDGAIISLKYLFGQPPMNNDLSFQAGDSTGNYSYIGRDKTGQPVYTPNGEMAVNITSLVPGTEGQIAGISIAILDSKGNVRKPAEPILNDFTETIRAEDPSADNSVVLQVGTKADLDTLKASIASSQAKKVVDKIAVTAATTSFTLSKTPTDDIVELTINHIVYYENEDFTVDRAAKTATWTATAANGGFDIDTELTDKVIFVYESAD